MVPIVKLGPGSKQQMSVNRTIKLWNQLPAEAPATLPYKSQIFGKRVRKVIISDKK